MSEQGRLARASAWMAAGSIVSRLTGLVRSFLLIWVLGTSLNADLFSVANTFPNSMYFLVAGGIFNVVLVPQIIRAMEGEDEGEGYIQRVVTLGLLVLLLATAALTIAVPLLLRVVFDATILSPEMAVQRESAQLLMFLCMPQVFFYGAFVLRGQILNAKQLFGPMMWAPILNNVVAIAMLLSYAVLFGRDPSGTDGFTTNEALVLGLGSTLGIAVQAWALTPFLRKVGYRFQPNFNFRGVGLGHTIKLGAWTLGFIIVSQVTMIAITRIASHSTLSGALNDVSAMGVTVYNLGYLISQVPHGIITVSITTALLPALSEFAARGQSQELVTQIRKTLRAITFLIAPIAMAVFVLGEPVAGIIALALPGVADTPASVVAIGNTISAFSLGLFSFSFSYFILRGFYADEDTRTPFYVQLAVASTNILCALTFTHNAAPLEVPARLALAFGLAYLVGSLLSTTILSKRHGAILDRNTVSYFLKLATAVGLAGIASATLVHFADLHVIVLFIVGLCLGGAVFAVSSKVLRIPEWEGTIALIRAQVKKRRA